MASLRCRIVAPAGVVFDGEAASLKGPGWEGGFGILPRHAPYLVRLLSGRLLLADADRKPLYDAQITGGFLMVAANECTVMVEGLAAPAGA
jgi:F-type H+-transporting ATPase subunit epsilon